MPDGGILWLTLRESGGSIVFRVADTGCVIPEDLLPSIFEPFVTRGKSKGAGLGLAIVKSVVESHHGTIAVQSTPGTGTAFEITIPSAGHSPATGA